MLSSRIFLHRIFLGGKTRFNCTHIPSSAISRTYKIGWTLHCRASSKTISRGGLTAGGCRSFASTQLNIAEEGFVYNNLTKVQLKEICRSRELKVSGNKPDLISRLEELDAPASANNLPDVDDDFDKKSDKEPNKESNKESKNRLTPQPPRAYQFCFDRASNYSLAHHQELLDDGRESDVLLSPKLFAVDESLELLELLPEELRKDTFLNDPHERTSLIEIVLDLKRRPYVWMKGQKRQFLNDTESVVVTQTHLDHISSQLSIGMDNRAGIDGHLHRISVMRNRNGRCIGATLRVGRFFPGHSVLLADILYGTNKSVLFVGPPGSAKTSIVRDVARLLSEKENVVIVDTSNEIGGSGDEPHQCIGMARRMQVGSLDDQASVMKEAVQNHTPATMIIDEIGRRSEVHAAQTCKERGVRMVASAHGSLSGLVRNSQLCDLVGGITTVTVGDFSARRRGLDSKTKTERKGPPIFDVIVELSRGHLHEWHVVSNVGAAVDSILNNHCYNCQIRKRNGRQESPVFVRNCIFQVERDSEEEDTSSIAASVVSEGKPKRLNGTGYSR